MNRPKQKWVVMVCDDCPCTYRVNISNGYDELKLCAYHEKLRQRWVEWTNRPLPAVDLPPDEPEGADEHAPDS